jgi:uncharacterized protein YfiM (DUF2279 family)
MNIRLFISLFVLQFSICHSDPLLDDSTKIEDKWLAFDKVQHFTYSFLWTLSSQYILVNNMNMVEEDALPFSVFSSVSAGIMKERYDMKKPKGYFSKKDLAANCMGILLACVIINDNFPGRSKIGPKSAPH